MRVIIKEVNARPEVREIENELSVLQEIVGGYIEVVNMSDFYIICNEEGKLLQMPLNIHLGYDIICGNAIFVSFDEDGEFASLTNSQIDIIDEFLERRSF